MEWNENGALTEGCISFDTAPGGADCTGKLIHLQLARASSDSWIHLLVSKLQFLAFVVLALRRLSELTLEQ